MVKADWHTYQSSKEILIQQRLKHIQVWKIPSMFQSSKEILIQQRLKLLGKRWKLHIQDCVRKKF